jgi:ketosteroid isomerase-like protein
MIFMVFTFYVLMGQSFAQERIEDLIPVIQSQNQIYMDGYKEKNADKVASVHSITARVFPPNKAPVLGRAAVAEMIAEEVAISDMDLTLKTQSLEWQGEDLLEVGKYSIKIVMDDGMVINDEGNTVVLWKKDESGVWLMDLDIWNSTEPLMF